MTQKIQKYSQNFVKFQESWENILENSPIEIIKELASVVDDFFKVKVKVLVGSLLMRCSYFVTSKEILSLIGILCGNTEGHIE